MNSLGLTSSSTSAREAMHLAQRAQQPWGKVSVAERARRVGKLRGLIAKHALELASIVASINERPVAEKLTSEVLPLADACRFLENSSARILRTRRFGSANRPLWLRGSSFEVERKPFGVVLVVGPRNYPLFLPMVQALQALAAGNAVLIKPAERTSVAVNGFLELVVRPTGIPVELISVLPEAPDAAHEAVRAGSDKVIFTGSSENGRALLRTMAERNTPGVMELSGADPLFVLRGADVTRAAKAIAFGLRLNAGDTCMAPHAIVSDAEVAFALRTELDAVGLSHLEIISVKDERAALELASSSDYGLGGSVFARDETSGRAFARELQTGFTTINDLIVPTADPRFPFGGTRASGYGSTRGAEGLLEMTYPHVVALRRGNNVRHFDDAKPGDETIFASFLQFSHGSGWKAKFRGLRALINAVRSR